MALLRYGNRSALTTKPARSLTSTASFPQAPTNAWTASMVAGAAVSGTTTSTSRIAEAGLKKWMPHTCSGRDVSIASSTTGSVEVLVARIASRRVSRSSSEKSAFLTARSSTTDSMTRSQSARSSSSPVARTRFRMSAASASVRRSRST